jgi:cytochrome c oxidase subunit II
VRRLGPSAASAATLLLAGCDGPQRVFDPAGPAAAELGRLGIFLIVATVVPALVAIAVAVAAVVRRRRGTAPGPGAREHRIILLLGGLGPALVVAALVVATAWVGNRVVHPPGAPAVEIEVIGHQFWWEVRYPGTDVVSANEIHVPVGEVVKLRVRSADVIHSLWVPQLQGKIDMIPGRTNVTWLRADREGVFRGQCAEFCGVQHARMVFHVVAEPPETFRRFLAREGAPRPPPDDPRLARGARVFEAARCDACHDVRGHGEPRGRGAPVPDPTHPPPRRALGAGTVPLTREALAEFILDPGAVKPGVRMPRSDLAPDDLAALVEWLLASAPGAAP